MAHWAFPTDIGGNNAMSAIHDHSTTSINDFRRRFWLSRAAIALGVGLYFLAGTGALAVSFNLHSRVIGDMLGEAGFVPYAIAACIESFKLCTIIVYDYIHRKNRLRVSALPLRSLAGIALIRIFQILLLVLSLVCTTTFIAEKFDRPLLAAVQNQDFAELKDNYNRKFKALETRQTQEKSAMDARHAEVRQRIEGEYKPLINAERQGIAIERTREGRRGRVMGGQFESHEHMLGVYTSEQQEKWHLYEQKTQSENDELRVVTDNVKMTH